MPKCYEDIFASHPGNDATNPWLGYSSAYGIKSGAGPFGDHARGFQTVNERFTLAAYTVA